MPQRPGRAAVSRTFAKRSRLLFTALALVLAVLAVAGCGSSGKGPVTLNWYVFPEPSGSFAAAAAACSKDSGGKYNISINFLSTSSDQQRVSLVRRLAADDPSIDILAMDVDWTAEFATAKWIQPVPAALAAQIRSVDLPGPVQTATWQGRIWAVPINSNTELLWYRKDLLADIHQPVPTTWTQMISDADELAKMGKPHYIEEQGAQYEGLTVWFNSLVDSDGGGIITGSNKVVVGPSTKVAASIMHELATSPAADPSLNVTQEGLGQPRSTRAMPRSRSIIRSSGSRPRPPAPRLPRKWATHHSPRSLQALPRTYRSVATTSASRPTPRIRSSPSTRSSA